MAAIIHTDGERKKQEMQYQSKTAQVMMREVLTEWKMSKSLTFETDGKGKNQRAALTAKDI